MNGRPPDLASGKSADYVPDLDLDRQLWHEL
jgi:hypothetical protein